MNDLRTYQYLALGDSYTIGEAIPRPSNFPNQVVSILNSAGFSFAPPRIIAKTGWTTVELEKGINEAQKEKAFLPVYDLVTLLIGVNNQYRGLSLDEYKEDFKLLLKKAIRFAGNQTGRVVVLSIPDWGVTPFANDRDRDKVAREIDSFNEANREISQENKVPYMDITAWTREAINDQSLLASDGLHPSGKEYKRWAERIAATFSSMY